jgi:hypothetical protein
MIIIIIKQGPRICSEIFCDDGIWGRGGKNLFILLLGTRWESPDLS